MSGSKESVIHFTKKGDIGKKRLLQLSASCSCVTGAAIALPSGCFSLGAQTVIPAESDVAGAKIQQTQQFNCRVYKTQAANGKSIIRKEVLLPNFLPRSKDGNEADYIEVRIDAATQKGINTLTPVAGGILRDSM